VTSTPVTPRPSAAVVLMRDRAASEGGGGGGGGEGVVVFMVRRHVRSEFAPDVYVFPGGSVKGSDLAVERAPGLCAPGGDDATGLGAGYRVAALRECFEEAGVLLARRDGAPLAVGPGDVDRFAHYRDSLNNRTLTLHDLATREGLTLATDELLHWSHRITPEAWPKRFDTHFFLAVAPPEQEAAHDRLEVTASVWTTPEDALAGYERGDFPLVFATEHQLRALANIPSVAAARDRFSAGRVRTMRLHVVHEDGREVIVLPDVPDGDEQ